MQTPRRVIVFLGPPGSGKGTQGSRLSGALAIPVISTGELLRQECRAGTELGIRIDAVLRGGQLLADDQMNSMVAQRLAAADCREGCILDGFPRTVAQAKFLESYLGGSGRAETTVFDFVVSVDELIERLSKRRQCLACNRIFSAHDESSGHRMICPDDRSLLVSRADDRPDAIRNRLQIYQRNTRQLTNFYHGNGYHRILANQLPDIIAGQLLEALRSQTSTLSMSSPAAATYASA